MAVSRSSTKGSAKSSTKATTAPKSSATTEYSGVKKRSGPKKPLADRKQKQSTSSKPAERKMYIVTRDTIDYNHDPQGGLRGNEIVGVFSSRNEANKAARAD